ncbi:MAG: hypothetical protein WCI05_16805, partial [Myxococcales bacterium]
MSSPNASPPDRDIWEILPVEISGNITLESVELTVPVAALDDDTDVPQRGGSSKPSPDRDPPFLPDEALAEEP